MRRRKFLAGLGALGAVPAWKQAPGKAGAAASPSALPAKFTPSAFANDKTQFSPFTIADYFTYADDLVIERDAPGQPHAGKVLAAVQAHVDDISLGAGGTVAKLINEGYTGYLIKFSNDEASGRTLGRGVAQNEIDNDNVAKAMGCKRAFTFSYRNHRMDDCHFIELRARLILLFRLLQVDTIFAMDPYNHYDENPDHIMVGKVVETANWMSSERHDYPEHFKAVLKPCYIQEKYYYPRSPQGHNLVNRIVDISSTIDTKARINTMTLAKGPAGNNGLRLREYLKSKGKRLPWLGTDDETANIQYTKRYLMEDFHLLGQKFGVEYGEPFHYIGPDKHYLNRIHDAAMKEAVDL